MLSACSGSIPQCGTLRLATYPSVCLNNGSTPPLPPPSPLPHWPCSQVLIPRSMITGARIQHFLPVVFSEAHSVDRQTKLSTSPYHFTCHNVCVRLVLSILGLCKDARPSGAPADLIRCYGSRRVLLVRHGILFRDGSLSISCRRVLCFCSIHFALSHFVSVNSASSGWSPISPSPLYAQARLPVSSHRA
jgi:hypothetical protein